MPEIRMIVVEEKNSLRSTCPYCEKTTDWIDECAFVSRMAARELGVKNSEFTKNNLNAFNCKKCKKTFVI